MLLRAVLFASLPSLLLLACGAEDAPHRAPDETSVQFNTTPVSRQANCLGEDASWCALARQIAANATARDVAFFEDRLLLQDQSCTGQPSLPEGCGAPGLPKTVRVVPSFQYGTDCCYVSSPTFADNIRYALDQVSIDASSAVAWEPYAVIRDSPFWDGDVSIAVRSAPPSSGIIELGVRQVDGVVRILGMIAGNTGTLYVFPNADFREIR